MSSVQFHTVQRGDQVFRILKDVYPTQFQADRETLTKALLHNNPDIEDIDRIYPGQVILLSTGYERPGGTCRVDASDMFLSEPEVVQCRQIAKSMDRMSNEEASVLGVFGTKAFVTGSLGFLAAVQKAMEEARHQIARIVREYYSLQMGAKTRGQYDYARKTALKTVGKKLGILETLVSKGNRMSKILQIDRKDLVRTHRHLAKIANLRRIGKLAKYGGWIGTTISLGGTAAEFHLARRTEDRIGIIADAAGGFAAGAAAGAAILLMTTPVGWVAALVIVTSVSIAGAVMAETLAEGLIADNWKSPVAQFLD